MNYVNWVQQREDYDVKYHVIKWKTSHFHEPFSNHMVGTARLKEESAAPVPAGQMQTEAEGLGFGLADKSTGGRFRPGLGLEDAAARNITDVMTDRDEVSILNPGSQERGIETMGAAVQNAALVDVLAAENTIAPVSNMVLKSETKKQEEAEKEKTTVLQAGRGNIKNRMQKSMSRLMEAYRKYREKASKILPKRSRPEKTKAKEKSGTRAADRESMLSLQEEDHYLLSSYDRTGNYSILGKK